MILAFTLTMPNNNAWDGKWSGGGKLYVETRAFRSGKDKQIAANLADRNFYYNFGDGWGANVEVTEVDSGEAQKLRNKSSGFCGYEWMIESIIKHGKIRSSTG
jgi:hypothetical protein